MDRPPPLRTVFASYFRILLAVLAGGLLWTLVALHNGWQLPQPIDTYLREQTTPRSPAKSPSR